MNRTRPIEALLAALASFGVALPLLTLFDANTWVRPSLLVITVIAVVGVGLRAATSSRLAVVSGQLVAGLLAVSWLHGRGHLYFGFLPGPDTFFSFGVLLGEAQQTVMTFSAPVPTERGVVVAITMLVGVTALVVDAVAVTWRMPALAGLGLLTAYLVSATNSGDGLSWRYFVLPVGAWLALLATQGLGSLRRWSNARPRTGNDREDDPLLGVAGTARILGVAAMAIAVAVPALVPHLPTTFIADGLGRADDGRGGGAVNLNTTLDLRRSLEDRSENPVVTYRTSTDTPEPLRVAILTRYRDGEWGTRLQPDRVVEGRPEPLVADTGVERESVEFTVTENRLSAPQIAMPTPVESVDLGGAVLRTDEVGSLAVDRSVDEYSTRYTRLDPTAGDFGSDGPGPPSLDVGNYLDVDEASFARLSELVDTVVPQDASALETARLLQAHFRSSQYTYSLELPQPTDPVSGRTMMADPLSNFLISRTGYCVQFTTAMIMASRIRGIPARMAIGFLPGTRDIDGSTYTVRAADAHSWPELWFPDLGWTRFEPTPGVRAGAAPEYSLIPTEVSPTETASPTATAPAATPTPTQRPDTDAGTTETEPTTDTGPLVWVRQNFLTVLAVVVLVIALLLVPAAAWVRRRRRRASARDDAERVEAEWASLVSRLGDLGFAPPDGASPRQAGARLTDDAVLRGEPQEAMGRIVSTLERARYAPPQATFDDVAPDARTVWRAALGTRQRSDRIRAHLLPGDGIRQWSDLRSGVLDWPRRAWSRLRRR
ncbi:uncharacterized protein DUF4129 [Knoellia remsis]|uniref:Uncharacterized protein DUF4129 n=1 Tax=Knoellia remsis TaxID=407159 RepID=A0A2T0UDR9_9MICO|nr:DUF3488 and transglutaminase-like domain-containing protein [Knoellia remsis]PRY56086.1 uncharacterized protein DUF4129 [Knoellia remsis]